MIIPINQSYRIKSDSHQWMVQRLRNRGGKVEWQAIHYFRTLEAALQELGERLVRESNARTVADALADIRNVVTTLSQALTTQSSVSHVQHKLLIPRNRSIDDD